KTLTPCYESYITIENSMLVVSKKDSNAMLRVVYNYRELNASTIKDYISLSRQDYIIEDIARARIRGKIDLPLAYRQLLMEEDDIHKTAFKTPFGMFEWIVMPQGLCNAPATF